MFQKISSDTYTFIQGMKRLGYETKAQSFVKIEDVEQDVLIVFQQHTPIAHVSLTEENIYSFDYAAFDDLEETDQDKVKYLVITYAETPMMER